MPEFSSNQQWEIRLLDNSCSFALPLQYCQTALVYPFRTLKSPFSFLRKDKKVLGLLFVKCMVVLLNRYTTCLQYPRWPEDGVGFP